MAIVTFNPVGFRDEYPQFSLFTDGQLKAAFKIACLLLDNTEASPVPYNPDKGIYDRETMLYLLVCHLCTLAKWVTEGQSGPVTSASEGSVSVSFSVPQTTGETYYTQTPCGQTFWKLAAAYRSGGRYIAVKHYHPWG